MPANAVSRSPRPSSRALAAPDNSTLRGRRSVPADTPNRVVMNGAEEVWTKLNQRVGALKVGLIPRAKVSRLTEKRLAHLVRALDSEVGAILPFFWTQPCRKLPRLHAIANFTATARVLKQNQVFFAS